VGLVRPTAWVLLETGRGVLVFLSLGFAVFFFFFFLILIFCNFLEIVICQNGIGGYKMPLLQKDRTQGALIYIFSLHQLTIDRSRRKLRDI
jgi:hypothetical protein